MIKCSVCILTFNSGKTLEQCLRSVSDFSDIIILDGGSFDNTLEVAKKYGARIFPQQEGKPSAIRDFTAVRSKLFSLAKEDWRLWLDSDEWLSPELRDKVKEIIEENKINILHAFIRKAVIENKIIDYVYCYPEYCKRLFNKNSDIYLKKGKTVHEDLVSGEKSLVVKHSEIILHAWHEGYRKLILKDDYYLDLSLQNKAASPFIKRLRAGLINILKAAKVVIMSFLVYLRHGFRRSLPLIYVWRFVRYHLKYAWKLIFLPNLSEKKHH